MRKKVAKKKSGKFFWGALLAVGSAVTAYVVAKFFSKKGELAGEPAADSAEDAETVEENYIILNNDEASGTPADSKETKTEEVKTEEVKTEEVKTEKVKTEEAKIEETPKEAPKETPTEVPIEDDSTKCIK